MNLNSHLRISLDAIVWTLKDPNGNLIYEELEKQSFALCFSTPEAARVFSTNNLLKKLDDVSLAPQRDPLSVYDLELHEIVLGAFIGEVIGDLLAYWAAVEHDQRPDFSEPSRIIVRGPDHEVVEIIGIEPLELRKD